MKKESIYGLTFEQLTAWLGEYGQKKSRALQVWDLLYTKRAVSFAEMTGVNEELRQLLEERFVLQSLEEQVKQESADGTLKFLFRLQDGNLIETVLMRPKFGWSVCVTTQVGCNIGCSFCASGLLSKIRDLACGEIVEQVVNIQRYLDQEQPDAKVSHVVVMGIGEPLDNFANVSAALQIIKEQRGLAVGGKHITVSTSGLADRIYEFADAGLGVNLAVSLHAPTDELRTRLMRINKTYPIENIMQAVVYYLQKTKRKVSLEYIMLKDVNDSKDQARQLAELIGDKAPLTNVNLIPYNPIDEHKQYQRSDHDVMLEFYDVLKKHGLNCNIRLEKGADIAAACGQLRSKQLFSPPPAHMGSLGRHSS